MFSFVKKVVMFLKFVFWLLLLFVVVGCELGSLVEVEFYQLGEVDFKVMGLLEVLFYFEKGFLLLYSFEYEDVCVVFQKVQEMDEDFVMVYWGEVMIYNQLIWYWQQVEKGWSIMV